VSIGLEIHCAYVVILPFTSKGGVKIEEGEVLRFLRYKEEGGIHPVFRIISRGEDRRAEVVVRSEDVDGHLAPVT